MDHALFWLTVVIVAIIGIWLFKILAHASGVSGLQGFAQGI